jgi:arylsulfatase A-like enzyme
MPQVTPAGVECHALLTALEVAPTILALAGVQPPENLKLDGVDMTPVLAGDALQVRDRMFWQRRDLKAARIGRWKWVSIAGEEALFDLEADLGERHDLSRQRPEKTAELRSAFTRWQAEMNAAPPRGPFRDY